ncbi:MAG: anaerobic glycerol-3-phosphate dehydrogenase subunit GlpA [Anaerolineae bacterium]|nr:anaerobic glycerol-3-phosphate dehydrogenase subunit GlpA [Anaerolineae bacterium]MDW8100189.1 anaerobic glycerol-3-phosphate dehydrogenase subunit GlpA [Anaerolineae bacterium]
MRREDTEILVIGGGATGTGVIRDLAMRGFRAVLVEKADLANGTTGRYHGLLHSGGRYAVKDPVSARECIAENWILRRIIPHCIEDLGGLFVVTPWDDPSYADQWVVACQACGIPVEEITLNQALRQEPMLNPQIRRAFRVPDAACDSFEAVAANAASARAYGAKIWNYHRVVEILRTGDRVIGARLRDERRDEEVVVYADCVVNAAGAWAGQIAAMAGVEIIMRPAKGTMVAMNHRFVNTILNRCHPPGDGDILVPVHTVSIIGTTSVPVDDPDCYPIEQWEIERLLGEGEKLVPGFARMRALRVWAGVRPLYEDRPAHNRQAASREKGSNGASLSDPADLRAVTRGYTVMDHRQRDGVSGFISIVGGKFTTYRLMAEHTVDAVCAQLGTRRPCRTAEEPVPGSEDRRYHVLGRRLEERERKGRRGQLVCECELVHRDQIEAFVRETGTRDLDDIRRGLRLGMGPCQGGFCIYRAAALLHEVADTPVEAANHALRSFLVERWKGVRPVLWGDQLRQALLDHWIFDGLLAVDRLPIRDKGSG